jgi:hypothetical protein
MSERDLLDEREPASSEVSGQVSLVAYTEGDEEATRFIETPRPEPPWIVQVTPLDRRVMSTERLLGELQRGEQIRNDTLVWREGMLDWRAVAQTDLSHSSVTIERLQSRWRQPRWIRLPAMSVGAAAVLVSIFLALYILWVGSVFDVTAPRARAPAASATMAP